MSKSKIAVVYARYSSHRQGEQSIEGQLAALVLMIAAYESRFNAYKLKRELREE